MRRVHDLELEKLALGELSERAAADVRRRLADAGELDRLARLEAATDARPMPPGLATRMRRAAERARSRGATDARTWSLSVLAASLAAVALVAMPRGVEGRGKGGAALVVYRQTTHGHEVLDDDAPLRPGDVLQLAIRPGRAKEAALYSIDGLGHRTEHLAPTRLAGEREHRLPDGFVLDDAPRFEHFFLVLGDSLERAAIDQGLGAAWQAGLETPAIVPGAQVIERHFSKEVGAPR